MSVRRLLCSLAACAAFVPAAQAATAWNESVSGDLANVGTSPTVVSVGLGSNTVSGTTGNPGTGVDRDYFTFTVPVGWEFSALNVLPGSVGLGGGLLFIGLQAGTQVTNPTSGSASQLLGWGLFGADQVGDDLLPSMSIPAFDSIGFTPPLGAGSYAVWIQETGSGVATYNLDFVLTAVPEPAAAWLLVAGLAGLGLRRRLR